MGHTPDPQANYTLIRLQNEMEIWLNIKFIKRNECVYLLYITIINCAIKEKLYM